MKIYFCGSIRGGRQDAALYKRMIEYLKQFGPVLTEHVGDPALTRFGNDGTAAEIWRRDTAWMDECDIVIAECSQVSMGVGYELAYLEAKGKPVHVFYGRNDGRLSAMIGGCPNFDINYYSDEAGLFARLEEIMRGRVAQACQAQGRNE